MAEEDIDIDIYGDLPVVDYDHRLRKLEEENQLLKTRNEQLEESLRAAWKTIEELRVKTRALESNISKLFKTAQNEIKRKETMISNLRTRGFRQKSFPDKLNSKLDKPIEVKRNEPSQTHLESRMESTPKESSITVEANIQMDFAIIKEGPKQCTTRVTEETTSLRTEYMRRMAKKLQTGKSSEMSSQTQGLLKVCECKRECQCSVTRKPDKSVILEDGPPTVTKNSECNLNSFKESVVPTTLEKQESQKNHQPSPVSSALSRTKTDHKSEMRIVSIFGSPLKWVDEVVTKLPSVEAGSPIIEDTCSAHLEVPSVNTESPQLDGKMSDKDSSSSLPKPRSPIAKYEDSVLGQFEDTIQFISALGKQNTIISPVTPLKEHPLDSNCPQSGTMPPPAPSTPERVDPKALTEVVSPPHFKSLKGNLSHNERRKNTPSPRKTKGSPTSPRKNKSNQTKSKLTTRNKGHCLQKVLSMQKYILECGNFFRKETSTVTLKHKEDDRPINVLIPRKTPRKITSDSPPVVVPETVVKSLFTQESGFEVKSSSDKCVADASKNDQLPVPPTRKRISRVLPIPPRESSESKMPAKAHEAGEQSVTQIKKRNTQGEETKIKHENMTNSSYSGEKRAQKITPDISTECSIEKVAKNEDSTDVISEKIMENKDLQKTEIGINTEEVSILESKPDITCYKEETLKRSGTVVTVSNGKTENTNFKLSETTRTIFRKGKTFTSYSKDAVSTLKEESKTVLHIDSSVKAGRPSSNETDTFGRPKYKPWGLPNRSSNSQLFEEPKPRGRVTGTSDQISINQDRTTVDGRERRKTGRPSEHREERSPRILREKKIMSSMSPVSRARSREQSNEASPLESRNDVSPSSRPIHDQSVRRSSKSDTFKETRNVDTFCRKEKDSTSSSLGDRHSHHQSRSSAHKPHKEIFMYKSRRERYDSREREDMADSEMPHQRILRRERASRLSPIMYKNRGPPFHYGREKYPGHFRRHLPEKFSCRYLGERSFSSKGEAYKEMSASGNREEKTAGSRTENKRSSSSRHRGEKSTSDHQDSKAKLKIEKERSESSHRNARTSSKQEKEITQSGHAEEMCRNDPNTISGSLEGSCNDSSLLRTVNPNPKDNPKEVSQSVKEDGKSERCKRRRSDDGPQNVKKLQMEVKETEVPTESTSGGLVTPELNAGSAQPCSVTPQKESKETTPEAVVVVRRRRPLSFGPSTSCSTISVKSELNAR